MHADATAVQDHAVSDVTVLLDERDAAGVRRAR